MEVSLFLADQYSARRDLLIAGALLHDIGKLRELSYETTTDYTVEGNLVGHIVIGVGMLRDAARELSRKCRQRLVIEIEHLILSHHGALELGSPVIPMTVEAFLLAAVDDLDAKLHQIRRASAEDDSPGRSRHGTGASIARFSSLVRRDHCPGPIRRPARAVRAAPGSPGSPSA